MVVPIDQAANNIEAVYRKYYIDDLHHEKHKYNIANGEQIWKIFVYYIFQGVTSHQ